MRFILLLAFCAIGLTASAQFWQSKPKPAKPAPIALAPMHQVVIVAAPVPAIPPDSIHSLALFKNTYSLDLAEEIILKEAKHNMRFRIYHSASYNFSDLAALYLRQNRYSEAKWYLLQSNNIARNEDNTRHLLDNLLALADIKNSIGESALAIADLNEARSIATAKGLPADIAVINKKMTYSQNNKISPSKIELRYAEAVEAEAAAAAAAANAKTKAN